MESAQHELNKAMNISEKIRQRYNEYVEQNGCTPK